MQNVKRKIGEGDGPEAKKKKVKFTKLEKEKPKGVPGKNKPGKVNKEFQKNSPKGGKPFNKGTVKGNFATKNTKGQGTTEKPKWSEMKKEKKELRIVRRKAKATPEVFEVSHKAKMLSAQIQRKVVKPEFKANACKELHCLLKGQYKSIALTHDLSRVIQVLLKHSPEDIKNEITEELLDIIVQMAQSKYAQHAVKRILKYGTDFIRHEVIKKFFGHIVSLATHTISAPLLDHAYSEFATKKEKCHMQQEFYGEIYKTAKDTKVSTLSDTYKDSPEMKQAILHAVKANIQKIIDKNLHDGELFHSVLYDYMCACTVEERTELVSALSPLLVPLTNSLPGANAASLCVWHGTNKDKKTILKVVKEHAVSMSRHQTGYRVLLAIFAAVDDTVLVRRTVVAALAAKLRDVASSRWGNMTLHWLVKPKDTSTFHPSLVKFLEEGAKSGNSKKDEEVRVSELREAIMPALLIDIESDSQFWLSSKANMLLMIAVLSIECTEKITEALATVICDSEWKVNINGKEVSAVEEAGIHMCLKKLAALDRGGANLGTAVGNALRDDALKLWISTNRGCFFLVKLIESNDDSVASKLVKKIKPLASLLKQQTSEGAKLLLQKVLNK